MKSLWQGGHQHWHMSVTPKKEMYQIWKIYLMLCHQQLRSGSCSSSRTQVQVQQQLELHISTFPSFTLLSFCMISQSHRQEVLHHGFSIGGRLRISTLSNCFPSTSSKNSTTRVVWQVSILCIFLIVYPKANKCNQYDYASSQAGNLRTHLNIARIANAVQCHN